MGAEPSMFLGLTAPNEVVVDQEMVDCALVAFENIQSVNADMFAVEQRVEMPQIHPNNRGTLDAAKYVFAENRIYLWDYKHGRKDVTPWRNLQLIDYALGLINLWNVQTNVEFVFRIVQPRVYSSSGPVKEWRATRDELIPFFTQLKTKADEAMSGKGVMSTGGWCQYCPAVGVCAAARKADQNAIDYVDAAYEIDEMNDEDLGYEFELIERALKVMKKRRDALADEVEYRVSQGSKKTGYAMESKKGRWIWRGSDDEVVALAAQFGVDAEVKSTRTVAQVRDAMPAAIRRNFDVVREVYAKRAPDSTKLVSQRDSLTSRVFGGNK
jgi:hypothetical protein